MRAKMKEKFGAVAFEELVDDECIEIPIPVTEETRTRTVEKRSRHKAAQTLEAVNGLYVCQWEGCKDQGFTSLSDLGVHIQQVHIVAQKEENAAHQRRGSRCHWNGCNRPWNNPFRSWYNLETHIRFAHTGERPYVCEFPGCGMAFCQSSDLRDHSDRHPSSFKKNRVDDDYDYCE